MEEPWLELILGADDPEVAASVSDLDWRQATVKSRHVIDALEEMRLSIESNLPITWKDACVKSGQRNYCGVGHWTIMAWYRDMHTTTTGDLRFTKSARGASSSEACSPFSKDKSLLIQFKAWARSDLEKLTVKKATRWVNEKLLAEWTATNLKNSNIVYPVKENVVARWMREAGF